MSKIRVLATPSDTHGVGKYRIIDPFTYIKNKFTDEFYVDINSEIPVSDLFFKKYDIVFFHSFIHKTTHEDNINRIKWLQKNNIKTIMDIDDYWAVDQRHPMFRHINEMGINKKKIEMLQLVDFVTTTTPYFADTIKKKLQVKNIHVFPNAIDPEESQFIPNKTQSDRTRFGWLGGSSHLYDLELLKNGIARILDNHKDSVQFVLCGFDTRGSIQMYDKTTKKNTIRQIKPEETVWFKYEHIFTNNFKFINEDYKRFLLQFVDAPYNNNQSYIRRWTRDINTYATNYNHFDVSLAPLVDTVFNNNKSELKIIESGFHRKPVIASDIIPYKGVLKNAFEQGKFIPDGNALLIPPNKNHKLWDICMKTFINNPNFIKDLGERLYETVKDKYSLPNVCKDRVEFIKVIINN